MKNEDEEIIIDGTVVNESVIGNYRFTFLEDATNPLVDEDTPVLGIAKILNQVLNDGSIRMRITEVDGTGDSKKILISEEKLLEITRFGKTNKIWVSASSVEDEQEKVLHYLAHITNSVII